MVLALACSRRMAPYRDADTFTLLLVRDLARFEEAGGFCPASVTPRGRPRWRCECAWNVKGAVPRLVIPMPIGLSDTILNAGYIYKHRAAPRESRSKAAEEASSVGWQRRCESFKQKDWGCDTILDSRETEGMPGAEAPLHPFF